MSTNRIEGLPDVSAQTVKAVPLTPAAREEFGALHAQVAIVANKREGFIRGIKVALGLPEEWVFNTQTMQFEPPKGAIVEHPEPGENGGVET